MIDEIMGCVVMMIVGFTLLIYGINMYSYFAQIDFVVSLFPIVISTLGSFMIIVGGFLIFNILNSRRKEKKNDKAEAKT